MVTSSSSPRAKKIAVIGAGASGICAAKYMLQAGFDVEVLEIGTQIGGIWVYQNDNGRSSAYESLHINSEKRNTQFSDFPFPKEVQYFPNHRDMATYLKTYADHFEVTPRIRFQSRVHSVTPHKIADGSLVWDVAVEGAETRRYDAVLVCTGHLTVPIDPAWASEFKGEYIHSHYYRTPTSFLGKRVLVVGSGNSGCDVTADLCVYASRTVMSARSPELIIPKLFLGVPVTQIVGKFERRWLPPIVVQTVRKIITRMVHGRMEDWGLRTPTVLTHPTSHATLINHLAYRRAEAKPGISRIEGKRVVFNDNSAEEFDVIIAATGYAVDYPFVSSDLLPVENGRADLYKRVAPIDYPGLYYIGLFNTRGSSNLRMFEVQCRWIAALERGETLMPTQEEMRRDIQARNAYVARTFPAGARHAVEIEPVFYTREMERETQLGAKRLNKIKRRLGSVPLALQQSRAVEPRNSAPRPTPQNGRQSNVGVAA